MKTKRLFLSAGACGLVAALVLGAKPSRSTSPPAATRTEAGATVRTLLVREQPLQETITATGTIRADESVEVRPEVAGKVTRIFFQEGSPIRAGDLLVSINDAELQATRQRAIHRRDLAGLKTRRQAALRDQGGVTQQEYDIAVSEFNVLDAEVALIEAQLQKTEIRAPFDGVVGLRSVSEGAYVTPATRIASIQRMDRIKVDFSVPEKYTAALSLDGEVNVTTAGDAQSLSGRVYAIEPLVDAATRTVQLRALCANPAGRLMFSGGFVTVRLTLPLVPNAILVPALSVVPGATEASVFIVEDGRASRRTVRTGIRTASAVQVLEGLHAGDQLIVSGLQQVRPGQPVRPVPEEPAPPSAAAGDLPPVHRSPTVSLN